MAAASFLACSTASAVVIRHDVPDKNYLVSEQAFPALADMPGVGHGVLIAPQWVVTAAHAIQPGAKEISIAGKARQVDRVIIHDGYRAMPQDMVQRALATNDATEVMAFLVDNHDVALIRLVQPVTDVAPLALYAGKSEVGGLVQLVGKGSTGNGVTGAPRGSPQRTLLRRAFNRLSATKDRWIVYDFDSGRKAHALEGMSGHGDSGGPILMKQKGRWAVAGLTSWIAGDPDLSKPPSRYGQQTYGVRLSYYAGWIAEVQQGFEGR
jgi:hypothetical protein